MICCAFLSNEINDLGVYEKRLIPWPLVLFLAIFPAFIE